MLECRVFGFHVLLLQVLSSPSVSVVRFYDFQFLRSDHVVHPFLLYGDD
jgi:hypothetical protein